MLLLTAITFSVRAQKVALHSSSGVQHFYGPSGMVNAYNAATSGDTIYLPGGSFNIPASINKPLLIFGAGHYPDSTEATGKTYLSGHLTLGKDADGLYMEGIEFTGNVGSPYSTTPDNLIIKRCRINGSFSMPGDMSTPGHNLAFTGNVIYGDIDLSNIQNVLISNNILGKGIVYSKGNQIINNVFLFRRTIGSYEHLAACDNNKVSNNVFYTEAPYGENGNGNEFRNNLFVNAAPGYGTSALVYDSYTGIPASDIFINVATTSFSYDDNYHLKSPLTYTGNDGSEIGIYGGVFPYKEGAVPSNPHISVNNIAPVTDSNGNLQISITVNAQND